MWRVWEWIGWAPERDDELPPHPLPFQPSLLWAPCATQRINRTQDRKTFVEFCVFISSIFLYDLNSLTALHYWITQEYDTCQDKHQLHYLIDKRNIGSLIILRRLRRKFMLFQGRCANWAWCSFRKLQLQCKEKMVSPVQRQNGKPSAESRRWKQVTLRRARAQSLPN